MKQLERLLLFQGNRCFFCDRIIPLGEASVEHLVASANGGSNDDANCVACCKLLNAAFGSQPYKEKLRAILSHRGQFVCPRAAGATTVDASNRPAPLADPSSGRLEMVLADLRKRGASRPRKVETLQNTIVAAFQKQISEEEAKALYASLLAQGFVTVSGSNVSYSLPQETDSLRSSAYANHEMPAR